MTDREAGIERKDRVPWVPLCFGLSLLGSLLSRWIGLWPGIAGSQLLLGGLVLALDRETLASRLRLKPVPVLLGIAGGLLMIAATYILYPLLGLLPLDVPAQTLAMYRHLGNVSAPFPGLLVPVVAVCEELVWRGAVQERLAARYGVLAGALLAGAAYGLSSLTAGSPLLLGVTLGCGLYWSLLRAWSGSLVVPLIAHLLWDAVVFVLLPLAHVR